jgi:PAS domain S-box-containing protein
VKAQLHEAGSRACKTAEDALRESEGLLAQGFEQSPIGMALTNLDGRFGLVNPAFARLLGYAAPKELVGVSSASLTHPDDAPENVAAMRVILEQGKPYQAKKRYIRTDGAVVEVLLAAGVVRDARGQPAMFFTQVEDIFEHSAAGSERARLAAIVECSQDAIIGKDRAGIVTVWNPGAQRMYGYPASEVIGRPVSQLVPEAQRGENGKILDRVLAGERIEHYQTERVCKDGSVVNVSLSVSPIYDAAGRVTGASSIARDVTSAIRAHEQMVLQAELLDEVDAAVTLTDGEGVVRYWSRAPNSCTAMPLPRQSAAKSST